MKYRLPILTLLVLSGALPIFWDSSPSRWLTAALGQGRGGGSTTTALPDPDRTLNSNSSAKKLGSAANGPGASAPSTSEIANGDAPAEKNPDKKSVAKNSPDGQSLIAEAAQRLFSSPSVEAEMRQRVELFGHHLTGVGSYKQQGLGDVKYLRLELKLQVADRTTYLQQVCDRRFLWVRRDSPFEKSLTRIDLKEVERAITAARGPNQTMSVSGIANQWMGLGGLPKLLRGLHENYEFGAATFSQINDSPMWAISGKLKPEVLAKLSPEPPKNKSAGEAAQLASLPSQWPDRVFVLLGRDQVAPLFPYRIEFQKSRPQKNKSEGETAAKQPGELEGRAGGAAADPVLTLELHEVRIGSPIDPKQFSYTPANQEVLDDTQRFLKNLGLESKP